jgi:hypothetical protein
LTAIQAEIAELQRAFPGVGQAPRSTEPKREAPAATPATAEERRPINPKALFNKRFRRTPVHTYHGDRHWTRQPGATHWTQTPEGKRKMAKIQKQAWARRRQREAGHVIPSAK